MNVATTQRSRPLVRALQGVWLLSLLVPWLCAYRLAPVGLLWLAVSYAIAALAILGCGLIAYLDGKGRPVGWAISLAVLNVALVTPELWLRVGNFHFEPGIQFGFPDPTSFQALSTDPDLFWRRPAGEPGVNSLGFLGPELQRPKPAGTYRVLFLGDSVPEQGYPAFVEAFLNADTTSSMRFEVGNFSTAGYSSYQGRIVAERYALDAEPDVVFVTYGWNDHWQAYGATDSRKKSSGSAAPPARTVADLLARRLRTVQWLRSVVARRNGAERPLGEVRVPLDEYRDNLTYIGKLFAARDIAVVFITPPTSHYALDVPEQLVLEGFASTRQNVTTLHKAYNDAVRDLAAAHHWRILDLEKELAALSPRALRDIFTNDGIHLSEQGMAVVGKRVADSILESAHPASP